MRNGSRSRLLAIVILVVLAIPLAVSMPYASAGGGGDQYDVPERADLKYPNLSFMLNQLVARVEAGETLPEEAAGDSPVHQGSSMAVTIYLADHVADAVQFLEDNGVSPRNVGEDYIEAYVPVTLLGLASEQPGVSRVRLIIPPRPLQDAPPVTGQGVQVHGSAVWNQVGYRGQGIKVGIIDAGFGGFVELMGTELPATVKARCYTSIGAFTEDPADCDLLDLHGTVVAESVIDIAPDVSLYIANPQSKGDLRAVTDWMVSEGVSVINHSIGWVFDGPGDGSSPYSNSPLETVDRAVAGGVLWVNAAGNAARETWFGPYSDSDGDAIIDFDGADELNTLRPGPSGGCNIQAQLRWEDSWGGASRDFDLYIVDTVTEEIVVRSEEIQGGKSGDVPYESLTLPFPENEGDDRYALMVVHRSGGVPDWLQLTVWSNGSIEHYTSHGSISSPAESANPGMLAVGAAPWYDVHTIEPFSSRGPTPGGQVKPDVVAADCGETALLPLDEDNEGFCGTSQSAPHVAGMAALVRQRFPEKTPVEVAEYLKDHAERRGTPIPNNTWGHGFAQLPAHEAVAPPTAPTVVFGWPDWTSVQLQTLIARYMVEAGYGYSTDAVSDSSLSLIQDLREGDINVLMEVWLPNQVEAWEAALEAGEVLSLGTSLGTDWQSAFVIPSYLQEQYPGLDNVGDLKEQRYKSLFATAGTGGKARLVSCVVIWPCEEVSRDQIEGYGLTDHVHVVNPSSEAALNESLYDAYERGDPWLGYQWGTSDPALLLDLVRLEEPAYSDQCWSTTRACAYEDATILIGAHSGLPDLAPDVVDFLRQWDFSADVHFRNVFRWWADNPDALMEDAALHWLRNNVDSWSEWVTEEAAARMLAVLPAIQDAYPCVKSLGTPAGTVAGSWTGYCASVNKPGSSARFYTFYLEGETEVQIDLTSSQDTYLFLLEGAGRNGQVRVENDDMETGNSNSRITATLEAGSHTIEATTYSAGATGDFTLTITPAGTTPPPTPPAPTDPCIEPLAGFVTIYWAWDEDACVSEVPGRGYARYFSFTVAQASEVTITLESEVDTYLYLREGQDRSGESLHQNDDLEPGNTNSRIQGTLEAGVYTVEATTYSPGQTGDFTLTVSGLGDTTPPPTPTTDSCLLDLGEFEADRVEALDGTWAEGCDSAERPGRHARYARFTLARQSEMTITLESGDADTYLYLREGETRSGDFLYENDAAEPGNTAKSQIQETLTAGAYTVEATTYAEGQTGSFTLTVSGLGGPLTSDTCFVGQTLAPGEGCYYQDFSIKVDDFGDLHLQFTGDRVDFDNLSLVRNGDSWSIESLP